MIRNLFVSATLVATTLFASQSHSAVMQFGDQDLCNTGIYPSDPTAGVALTGVPVGAIQLGPTVFSHTYPFAPAVGEFPGTDEIHTAAGQSGAGDGYSVSDQRVQSPLTLVLDYSSLIPAGENVDSLTLGIMTDDFQFPFLSQPFTATLNGVPITSLTSVLNALDQSGPVSEFLTVGIDPSILTPDHTLILILSESGTGADGFAVDFLTVGVTTSIPEPCAVSLIALSAALLHKRPRRSRCA